MRSMVEGPAAQPAVITLRFAPGPSTTRYASGPPPLQVQGRNFSVHMP